MLRCSALLPSVPLRFYAETRPVLGMQRDAARNPERDKFWLLAADSLPHAMEGLAIGGLSCTTALLRGSLLVAHWYTVLPPPPLPGGLRPDGGAAQRIQAGRVRRQLGRVQQRCIGCFDLRGKDATRTVGPDPLHLSTGDWQFGRGADKKGCGCVACALAWESVAGSACPPGQWGDRAMRCGMRPRTQAPWRPASQSANPCQVTAAFSSLGATYASDESARGTVNYKLASKHGTWHGTWHRAMPAPTME